MTNKTTNKFSPEVRERAVDAAALPADYFAGQLAAADKLARGHGSQPELGREVFSKRARPQRRMATRKLGNNT